MAARKALPPAGFSIPHLMALAGGYEFVAAQCQLKGRAQWGDVIPSKHVLTMSKLTGLSIETLRPDMRVSAPTGAAQVSAAGQ